MKIIYCLTGLLLLFQTARAQDKTDVPAGPLSLEQCLSYALDNQPAVKQAEISEDIADKDVKIRLSDWMPQVSVDGDLQDNVKRTTNVLQIGDQEPQTLVLGTQYTSTVGLSVNQVIFNNDVLLAGKTASDYRERAVQNTTETKIDLVVNVSKAYYQVLTTQQQISVLEQTIDRLKKNYDDARNRYEIGVSDKIDYKRAKISLNNAYVQKKGYEEGYKAQKARLKQLIGFPPESELSIKENVESMETESLLDTIDNPEYSNRIEYQSLQTEKRLSEASISYYKQNFLPSLSAFYNYNWAFLNDNFSDLYNQDFPNSVLGLTVSLPIFQGMRRIRNIQKVKLQDQQLEYSVTDLKAQINSEYMQALGDYKTNLKQLQASSENYEIAQDVYETVKLQYDEGIKAYLEVIVADSDLRTSQLNYLNALLNVLSSKLDVEKAAGTITIPTQQ